MTSPVAGLAAVQPPQPILVRGSTGMELDGKPLLAGNAYRGEYEDHDNDFAQKDGFRCFMEMADWFAATHGPLPFKGYVIEWRES